MGTRPLVKALSMLEALIANLILIAGLSPLLWRFYAGRKWVAARGTVTDLKTSIGESSWVLEPTIEFMAGARRQAFVGCFAPGCFKYKIGEVVDVLYNPAKPSRVIVRAWMSYVLMAAVTEVSAFVVLLIIWAPLHF
jgi:hypothetical protein